MKTERSPLRMIPLLVALFLGAAACGSGTASSTSSTKSRGTEQSAPATTKLTLQLNFPPYPADHAYYYYGKSLGLYQKQGIALSLQPGTGSAAVLQLVANGTQPIALVDVSTMLTGISKGAPLKSIAVLDQLNPGAFIFKKSKPITTVADIKGKKIALTTGDAFAQILPAILSKVGLSESSVTIVSIASPNAKVGALVKGSVDAFLGFGTTQPLQIASQFNIPTGALYFSDLGVNTLGLALVANESWLSSHTDLAARFVRATQQAIGATRKDPAAAAAAFSAAEPGYGSSALDKSEIEETLKLLHTTASAGKPIGYTVDRDWTATTDLLTKYEGLPKVDLSKAYTNDLVGK